MALIRRDKTLSRRDADDDDDDAGAAAACNSASGGDRAVVLLTVGAYCHWRLHLLRSVSTSASVASPPYSTFNRRDMFHWSLAQQRSKTATIWTRVHCCDYSLQITDINSFAAKTKFSGSPGGRTRVLNFF